MNGTCGFIFVLDLDFCFVLLSTDIILFAVLNNAFSLYAVCPLFNLFVTHWDLYGDLPFWVEGSNMPYGFCRPFELQMAVQMY